MNCAIEKEYRWEMAHRLVGRDQEGKIIPYCDNCKNLHGHSYRAVVRMTLRRFSDLDHYGMVFDYNKMKVFKKWIDDNLDHCVMISSYDKSLLAFVQSQQDRDKHFIIDSPSTAEHIVQILYREATKLLNDDRAEVCEVRINETCTSEAIYREHA